MCPTITTRWRHWRAATANLNSPPRWRRDGSGVSNAEAPRGYCERVDGARFRSARQQAQRQSLVGPCHDDLSTHEWPGLIPPSVTRATRDFVSRTRCGAQHRFAEPGPTHTATAAGWTPDQQRTAPGRAKRVPRRAAPHPGHARCAALTKKGYVSSFTAPGFPPVESILAAPE